MATAVKCDKCGQYFDRKPVEVVELADGWYLWFHILRKMTKEEMEACPVSSFMTFLGQTPFKPQDTCGKCQSEMVKAALNNYIVRAQIEEIQ